MEAIKYLNKRVGRELYKLRENHYETFLDLLIEINNKRICDSRQLDILIKLDYFSEFGNPNQLLYIVDLYTKYYGAKQLNKADIEIPHDDMIAMCEKETEKKYVNVDYVAIIKYLSKDLSEIKTKVKDRIRYENDHLGYVQIKLPGIAPSYCYVSSVDGKYANKNVTLYRLFNGSTYKVKVKAHTLSSNPIEQGDVIQVLEEKREGKWSKTADGFVQSDTEFELILKKYAVMGRG